MAESNVLKKILLKGSKIGATLFRNNVGTGWAGKVFRPPRRMQVWIDTVDVVVRNARPLHAGLCEGSSDSIGYMSILVTKSMLGKKVAVFVALEVKDTHGKPSPEQINFINMAKNAGAIAGIVYSDQEAEQLFNQHIVSSN